MSRRIWQSIASCARALDGTDARFHPTRPIPSGLLSRELAFRTGAGLLAAGVTVLIFGYAGLWVVGAATALVLYGSGGGLNPGV